MHFEQNNTQKRIDESVLAQFGPISPRELAEFLITKYVETIVPNLVEVEL